MQSGSKLTRFVNLFLVIYIFGKNHNPFTFKPRNMHKDLNFYDRKSGKSH
jgi:hypothetical protein